MNLIKLRLKFLLFLVISITYINVYSQVNPKVKGELEPSIEQKSNQVKINERDKKILELTNLEKRINFPANPSKRGFSSINDTNVINRLILENQTYIDKFNNNPRLLGLAKEIDALNKQLGFSSMQESIYSSGKKNAEYNINLANQRLAELKKNNADQKSLTEQIKEVDLKLQALEKESKSLDAQLKNKTVTTGSLDDFLTKKSSTNVTKNKSTDFLAKPNITTGNSHDILSNQNSKGDFLSQSIKAQDNTNGTITNKDKTIGVIDPNGKVLIPFKNWRIHEYKNGIASVSIELASYTSKKTRCIGYYEASVKKFGYVDQSGSFIDGYKITSYGKWVSDPCLTLVEGNGYIDHEKERKNRQLIINQYSNEGKKWLVQTLNQYK